VVGPHSVSQYGLTSDYAPDQLCYNGTYSCIQTIGDAITKANVGGVTLVAQGVDIKSQRLDGIPEVIQKVLKSDIVVLLLGIDRTVEYEGIDRPDILLP